MNSRSKQTHPIVLFGVLALLGGCSLGGCSDDSEDASSQANATSCPTLTGTSWTPSIEGLSESNHDSAVSVTTSEVTATTLLTGLGQGFSSDRVITISFDVASDLGANGALSLIGEVTGFPSDREGSAYPMLISLSDGVNELVNLSRSGSGGDCAQSGFYSCSNSVCVENTNCVINSPSAYEDRYRWEERQEGFGNVSTNVFPTCNWSSGSPACAFNSTFFSSGKLRTGTYTAKYVLMADSYAELTGYTGEMRLTLVQKTDTTARTTSTNGAIDLNVILVGDVNVEDSRTETGKRNLDLLFGHVASHYSQTSPGIKLGKITVYEWDCAAGGDAYTDVDASVYSQVFREGSELVGDAEALNIFIVSTIPYEALSGTVLGLSGAIAGPYVNGTGASGLAFASFEDLDAYNTSCTTSSCPFESQSEDFIEMANTISHEIGHFLGLNHPSESDGDTHDSVPDTPECQVSGNGPQAKVSHNSCLNGAACEAACPDYDGTLEFCPEADECQFNHVMWWTTKRVNASIGGMDGNIFSDNSSAIINSSPFVR